MTITAREASLASSVALFEKAQRDLALELAETRERMRSAMAMMSVLAEEAHLAVLAARATLTVTP